AKAFASTPFERIADPLPDMLRWQRLVRLLALRAIREAHSGHAEESLATALTDLRISRLVISDSNAVLIHRMIGLSLGGIGSTAISASIAALLPTAAQSREWTDALASQYVDPEAWRAMWTGEYRVMKRMLIEANTDDGAPEFVDDRWYVEALW